VHRVNRAVGVSGSAFSGAGFVERENEFQMTAPETERDMERQGCSIRELGDTTPFSSKKAEETSAAARGGPERAFRFDDDWIAFREPLAVELGSPADSIVGHAVLGLGAFGEDVPNGAFGSTLEVVSRHLGREEGEQAQHQEAEKKSSDQSDDPFQVSHVCRSPSIGRRPA
jgi:hypothetical protein